MIIRDAIVFFGVSSCIVRQFVARGSWLVSEYSLEYHIRITALLRMLTFYCTDVELCGRHHIRISELRCAPELMAPAITGISDIGGTVTDLVTLQPTGCFSVLPAWAAGCFTFLWPAMATVVDLVLYTSFLHGNGCRGLHLWAPYAMLRLESGSRLPENLCQQVTV